MEEENINQPLADRIRPLSLDGFFGQEEVVGEEKLLRQAIKSDKLPSLIFWGPPGSGKTIFFLDEIHRWNKKQQDALLPYVEKGLIILIGATTENPSFEVIGAFVDEEIKEKAELKENETPFYLMPIGKKKKVSIFDTFLFLL